VRSVVFALLLFSLCLACSSKKQSDFVVAHQYTMTGTVLSLNSQDQTASIDSAAIPNYMEAMTMNYPVKSKAEFDSLRVGEKIKATLNVNASNDEYHLTGIQELAPGKK
jgi:Cu/Ag efflux protein CusF